MSETATAPTAYRVIESFSFDRDGVMYTMRRGDVLYVGNPALEGRTHLCEPIDAEAERRERARTSVSATETAVSAPGSLRQVTAPADTTTPDAPPPPGTTTPESPAPPQPVQTPPPPPGGTEPTEPTPTGRRRAVKDQPQA